MSAEDSSAESKYEIRECIGKGAFGEVNLVVEKQSKQRYVLKRIKMARQSEWQRKATRQEIEIVSRLRHPFIMPYKEHWTHHGHTINVVYGYCEKGDLTSAITKQKGKYFSEETLRLWLAELLLAVDYMHRQNVLHRDIKTQNILLTGDGDVQIGDFGLSTVRVPSSGDISQQQAGDDDTDPRMDSSPAHYDVGSGGAAATPEAAAKGGGHHHTIATAHVPANHAGAEAYTNGLASAHANGLHGHQPGDKDKDQLAGHTPVHDPKAGTRNDYALVGTPHFMSPELLSSQKYSYETDIWSLGVVMYEMTTLKPPFNAFNLAGLVAKIKRAALPPIPASYSADWTAILKSMLRKDPTRRASPLELLAIPSMHQALQQARQRALAISPDFVMPELPILDTGVSPGFCFDVAAPTPGGAAAAAGAGFAGLQRTPSAVGASTPVLMNPLAIGSDDAGGAEPESSPLSKFPDLGSEESPLPALPVPAAAAPTAAAPTATAAAPADTNRSKTPATTRRSGGPGVPAPGAAGAAAAGAPAAKRPVSPQRTRAPPLFGGGQRSKTPGRAFGVATAPAAKAEADANGRLARKPSTARETRSRSVMNTAVATSPRDRSGGGAGYATGVVTVPASARASSPERQLGRKAGPNSGPAPRVVAGAAFRASGNAARRSLLDAVGGQQQPQQHALPSAPVAAATTASVQTASEIASPGLIDATAAGKGASPQSAGGHQNSTSPGVASVAPHVAAGAATAAGSRVAPWRAVRSVSVSTARTSRTALAAGSSPPQASPRCADAAANGGHQAAGAKRPVSVARGSSTDSATAAAAAAASTNPKRAPVAADGAKRPGHAVESGSAMASARARNTTSPPHRSNAASTFAVPAAAAARRRSQPGTAGAAATAAKDAADPGAQRLPEKRVRRSSFMSYGKPVDSAPLQRRPTSSAQQTSVGTARYSAPGPGAAAANVRPAATARDSSLVASHPLAASDAAADSSSASAACSPIEQPTHALGPAKESVAAAAPDVKGGVSVDVDESLSSRLGSLAAAAAAAIAAGGSEPSEPAAEAAPAAGVGAGTGAATSGVGHPWRSAPRSRSLMSMTTEDSELSLPDGSGRYGPVSETNGGVYDVDLGAAAAGFMPMTSPGRGAAASIIANPVTQPLWSCNQLFSGSYGSCAGSITDISAAAAAAAAAPLASGAAALPGGGAVGGGNSGVRGIETMPSLGGGATLTADLPRRVSASAFTPHIIGSYNTAAAAALAAAGGDAADTESEASTPAEPPRGSARVGLRPLTLSESETGGGGPMQLISPGRFDLVASSPAAGAGADSPSPLSSSAASPLSAVYGSRGGMEIVSPTAATMPPSRRHGSSSSYNMQLQKQRSDRSLDARASVGAVAAGGSQSYFLSSRKSGDASYCDASPLGSTISAAQRVLAQQKQESADDATAAAAAAVAAPADSCSEVTSQLRPVAEDADGEAESVPQHQQQVGISRGATASDLSASERAQLALLQRVVALAGSLWEMGRDDELGAVLSSTLSRALVRRPGTASTALAAATAAPVSGPHQSASLSPSQSLRQRALELGDSVRVTAGPLRGTETVVRYRGPCHWGAGTVLGLELPHPTAPAGHSGGSRAEEAPGCRDGVRYFRCHQPGGSAAFVGADQVVLIE